MPKTVVKRWFWYAAGWRGCRGLLSFIHFRARRCSKTFIWIFGTHTALATRAVGLCSTNPLAGFGGSIARNCSETQISSIFAHAAVVKHFLEGHCHFSKDPGFRSEIHSLQCCAGSPSACFRRQNRNLRHVQGRLWYREFRSTSDSKHATWAKFVQEVGGCKPEAMHVGQAQETCSEAAIAKSACTRCSCNALGPMTTPHRFGAVCAGNWHMPQTRENLRAWTSVNNNAPRPLRIQRPVKQSDPAMEVLTLHTWAVPSQDLRLNALSPNSCQPAALWKSNSSCWKQWLLPLQPTVAKHVRGGLWAGCLGQYAAHLQHWGNIGVSHRLNRAKPESETRRQKTMNTKYYKVLLRTTKYYSLLLCTTLTTEYYSSTTKYYSVLQSSTPLLLCTTK